MCAVTGLSFRPSIPPGQFDLTHGLREATATACKTYLWFVLSDKSAAVSNERSSVTITLSHIIVPGPRQEGGGAIFCAHFCLHADLKNGHFAPVRINDTLTLRFDDHEDFESHHYAFHVSLIARRSSD